MSPACVADTACRRARRAQNASRCRFARCRRTPPARDLATPRLEPGRGLAALHGGLIGGRGIARSRVLIDRERHFLLSVGADEDDRSRCDRVPDARFVPPRVRLGGDIREVLGHHTYGHDISREQRGRGGRGLGRRATSGGVSSQGRFGDFSSVSVDPSVSGCAFATQQYFGADGNWRSRITPIGRCESIVIGPTR